MPSGLMPGERRDHLSDPSPVIHIVDDDPSVCRALKRLLHSWGMQVRTFASGREFLSALSSSQHVDCSVIDVQMPEMTGLEVQTRMRSAGMNLPIIFITAHEEEGIEERALREGAVGFLRKPFSDEVLVGLIRNTMERRREAETSEVRHGP
jgi:FixJ family two-component response regulator